MLLDEVSVISIGWTVLMATVDPLSAARIVFGVLEESVVSAKIKIENEIDRRMILCSAKNTQRRF